MDSDHLLPPQGTHSASNSSNQDLNSSNPIPLSLPVATLSLSLSSLLSPRSPAAAAAASTTTNLPTFKTHSKKPISLFLSTSLPTKSKKKTNRNDKSSANSPLQSLSPFLRRPPADPSAPFAGRRCAVVWLRADLRVHDNEALTTASNESVSLLPVFLLDPRDFGRSPSSGFDRTGPYRAAFLLDSVRDLRQSLRSRGSDLVVRIGRPETVLPELARSVGADAVYTHREVSREEVKTEERVEKALEKEGVEIKYFWGSTLYHIDDLPFGLDQMPTNYGGFREKVKELAVRRSIEAPERLKGMPARGGVEPGEIPTLTELGLSQPPVVTQEGKPAVTSSLVGGETEALERLKKFAEECRVQPKKAEGKNGNSHDSIYGANFSCKISPWLATGCLSPRFMFEELKKTASRAISAASAPTSDSGMNWLMFELLWRDFFRFITKKYSSPKKSTEEAPVTACTGVLA